VTPSGIQAEIDAMKGAIGAECISTDVITPELVRRFAATVGGQDPDVSMGVEAPPAIHWCLAPFAADTASLGPDGHPSDSLYPLPPSLTRRMWASGELRFHGELRIGDVVHRTSRVAAVTPKQGGSGLLCFVTLEHTLATPRGTALTECQTIVYRAPASPTSSAIIPADADSRYSVTNEAQLFRYSALTFNAHRIHYDYPYATHEEGYPGLVVQGPLQATLLLMHANMRLSLKTFSFKGLKPLFCGESFSIESTEVGFDIVRSNGDVTMSSKVNAET